MKRQAVKAMLGLAVVSVLGMTAPGRIGRRDGNRDRQHRAGDRDRRNRS